MKFSKSIWLIAIIHFNLQMFVITSFRVKDGSENPFMKRSGIKDYNEQPDP